jgi:hypothetical protein
MSDEILTPDKITTSFVKQLLEDAYLEVEVDEDGDLRVKDGAERCFVIRSSQGPDRIKFLAYWKESATATRAGKLEYVNKVNEELIGPKAYARERGGIGFEHYLFLEAGVTKRSIVSALKMFLRMQGAAVAKDTTDVIG